MQEKISEKNKMQIYVLSQIVGLLLVIAFEIGASKTANIHLRAIAILLLLVTVLINVFRKNAYKCRRALAIDKEDETAKEVLDSFYQKQRIIFWVSTLCQIAMYSYYFMFSKK